VEKVDNPSSIYARKLFLLRPETQSHQKDIEKVLDEVKIIRRLRHQHIIQVEATYQWKRQIGILILPVADKDLATMLNEVDNLQNVRMRANALEQLLKWPGCLVQAMDYIHEMRVIHKDIKPSNILIKNDDIYITDFGISRDVIGETTTGTTGSAGAHTPMYCAPEVTTRARKGRSADIFSLGAVLLELATVLIGPPGSLARFKQHRKRTVDGITSNAYAGCPKKILQWIWHLWALWAESVDPDYPRNSAVDHGIAIPDLAFFMLDPNPSLRIRASQLVSMLRSNRGYYIGSITAYCCEGCRSAYAAADDNPRLHSIIKDSDDITYAASAEKALVTEVAEDWETAKRLWLQHHMWWEQDEQAAVKMSEMKIAAEVDVGSVDKRG